jgi:hypothetical protein
MVHLQSFRGLLTCMVLAASGLLAGCGGSSSDTASTAAAAGTSGTTATAGSTGSTAGSTALNPGTLTTTQGGLTITGAPVASVTAGQAYAFHPSATDTSGKSLQYSISGRPLWAIFNSNTGMLSGTPTSADVGVNVGVQITATDGATSATLPAFEITVNPPTGAAASLTPPASTTPATANSVTGNVTLAWVAPTANTNGSALTNLAGYKIYYGTASKQYTSTISVSNPATLSYVINSLTVGQQYFFAVTAVSSAGVESSDSPEISGTIS